MRNYLSISLFSILTSTSVINAQVDSYGYTKVEASTGNNYQKRVFFDLSSNTLTEQSATNWDVAFYRTGSMSIGSRINDAQGIDTYVASTDPAAWDAINVSDLGQWGEPLYNPDNTENIGDGAFEQANLTCSILSTGWGCYNMGTHHIDGKTIYVLKYPDGKYIKFMITDFFGGYTFKYSKWDGSTWGATTTKTIANGTSNTYFNYYSLQTDAEVSNNEPASSDWDLMFTRYWTFYNNIMMYRMSGVIQNPNISVAKTLETQETSAVNLPAATEFKKGITTIGHSWKPTSGLVPNVVYYIKEGDKYYRLYFTENGGATTGNMYFKYKDITSLLATAEFGNKLSFAMYPNPAIDKKVTILFDVKDHLSSEAEIIITDQTGKAVLKTQITKNAGFYKKEVALHSLSEGVYFVTLKTTSGQETKKLIIK